VFLLVLVGSDASAAGVLLEPDAIFGGLIGRDQYFVRKAQ
jgi:hypothetical protein